MLNIPLTTSEITTDWLRHALEDASSGTELLSSELVDHDSGTTGRARYSLSWQSNKNHNLPKSIFLKLTPTDPIQQETNRQMHMGETEARFYRSFSKNVSVTMPAGYYSDWSTDKGTYILIMEDVRASGGRDLKLGRDFEFNIAEQMIESFAKLHAHYWDTPLFESELSWVTPYWPARAPQIPSLIDRSCDVMSDLLPPILLHAKRFFRHYQQEICDFFDSGTPTLVHGDPHMSNLYMDKDGNVGFLDWALVSRMPAIWDVAYMCLSFPPQVRRRIETELLPRYCETLKNNGGPSLNVDDVFSDFRSYAMFSWISAMTTLGAGERMQPLEWGIAAANWTTTALEELDILSAMKENLGVKGV